MQTIYEGVMGIVMSVHRYTAVCWDSCARDIMQNAAQLTNHLHVCRHIYFRRSFNRNWSM